MQRIKRAFGIQKNVPVVQNEPYELQEVIRFNEPENTEMYGNSKEFVYNFLDNTIVYVTHYNEPGTLMKINPYFRRERVIAKLMRGVLQMSLEFANEYIRLRNNPYTPIEEFEKLFTKIAEKKDFNGKPINELIWSITSPETGKPSLTMRVTTDRLKISIGDNKLQPLQFLSNLRKELEGAPRENNMPKQVNTMPNEENNMPNEGNNMAGGRRRRKTGKRRQRKRLTRRR